MNRLTERQNALLYLCGLIECISREAHQWRAYVVNKIGYKQLQEIYDFSDVYHCEDVKQTAQEFIEKYGIVQGEFNDVDLCKYRVPGVYEIGEVYSRLIDRLCDIERRDPINLVMEFFNSFVGTRIGDFNCDMYYQTPDYLLQSYLAGMPIMD